MDLDRYIKRKTIIVQVLLLITILYLITQSIFLAVVGYEGHNIITIDFLRQFDNKRLALNSIKPFYNTNSTLEYIEDKESPILKFKSFDTAENVYNGFGIFKFYHILEGSKLHLTWRISGLDLPIILHVSDMPPAEQLGKIGEDYVFDTQSPGKEWEELIIPISQFIYNQWWQPDNVYDDGKLDLDNMFRLEISFATTEDFELD